MADHSTARTDKTNIAQARSTPLSSPRRGQRPLPGNAPISRSERETIVRIIRKRERVAKALAAERAAALRAQFEAQIAAIYHFDQDAVWRAACGRLMTDLALHPAGGPWIYLICKGETLEVARALTRLKRST